MVTQHDRAVRVRIEAFGSAGDGDDSAVLTALDRFSSEVLDPAVAKVGGRLVDESIIEVPDRAAADDLARLLDEGSAEHLAPTGLRLGVGADDSQVAPPGAAWRRPLRILPLGGIGFAAAATGYVATRGMSAAVTADPLDEYPAPPPEVEDDHDHDDIAAESTVPPGFEGQEPTTLFEGLDVYGADEEGLAVVTIAVERMAAYGMELAVDEISIGLDPTREACDGNTAFAATGGEESLIVVCNSTVGTLVHELTHVWASKNLSDEDKAAWVEERGLDAWGDGPWRDRGSEHLADIVAWGMDDEFRPPVIDFDNDIGGLHDSFSFALNSFVGTDARPYFDGGDEDLLAIGVAGDPLGLGDLDPTTIDEPPRAVEALTEPELDGSFAGVEDGDDPFSGGFDEPAAPLLDDEPFIPSSAAEGPDDDLEDDPDDSFFG